MYKKFRQSVSKKAIFGYKWVCKACSSPAAEYSELDMEENVWVITRIKCQSCGQVWRREET